MKPDPTQPFRVAIVGAGWAGLACAEYLSRRGGQATDKSSLAITLIEAAPQLGGRARGLVWTPDGWPPSEALPIDNGQHLLIGAYSETSRLLEQAGIEFLNSRDTPWLRAPLHWAIPREDHESALPSLPAQERLLHVASEGGWMRLIKTGLAAMRAGPVESWPIAWRLSLGQTLFRAWRAGWSSPGTASDWWHGQRLPPALLRFFWRPLVEGALNTPFEQASAAVALRVVHDSLMGKPYASDTLHPASNLSDQAITPLGDTLRQRGVKILTRCRVTALSFQDVNPLLTAQWQLRLHPTSLANPDLKTLGSQYFDAVILALPAHASQSVCQDLNGVWPAAAAESFYKEQKRWAGVESLGVTTVYAALTREQAQQARLSPQTLRPIAGRENHVAMVLARPLQPHGQVIAAVASASRKAHHSQTIDALRSALERLLAPRIGVHGFRSLPLRVTHEDRATWACTADHVDSGMAWGPSAIGPVGLFRSGDDLTPGYPACIESAVRGGVQTAKAVLALAARK